MVRVRRKGRRLPKGRIRAMRDLCYRLLTDQFALTPADAHAVMTSTIDQRQARARSRAIEPLVRVHGVLTMMSVIASDEADAAVLTVAGEPADE